jgi:tripeptide aminopeptidase
MGCKGGICMNKYYSSYFSFDSIKANKENKLKINKPLLIDLLGILGLSEEEDLVIDYIIKYVVASDPKVILDIDMYGNLFFTKGKADIYPCIVAHMDEVCGDQEARVIIDLNNVLVGLDPNTGDPAGCPGDDRVGVYCALELMKVLPVCKVAFFVEEEIGARKGSGQAQLDFFKNCSFILQADRAGDDEIIVESNGGNICSKDFQDNISKLIKSYNYKFSDMGSFTDCGVLSKRGVGISCINLGAGYYNNHSDREKVCPTAVENCLNIMYEICLAHSNKKWPNKHRSAYKDYSVDGWEVPVLGGKKWATEDLSTEEFRDLWESELDLTDRDAEQLAAMQVGIDKAGAVARKELGYLDPDPPVDPQKAQPCIGCRTICTDCPADI